MTDYRAYIVSVAWQQKRLQALRRAGFRCEAQLDVRPDKGITERCQNTNGLQVHHLTYERLGRELLTDLQVLCRACHIRAEDLEGYYHALEKDD